MEPVSDKGNYGALFAVGMIISVLIAGFVSAPIGGILGLLVVAAGITFYLSGAPQHPEPNPKVVARTVASGRLRNAASKPPVLSNQTLASINRLHYQIRGLVMSNQEQALIQSIGLDVLREADELVREATMFHRNHEQLALRTYGIKVSDQEIKDLQNRIDNVHDDRLKQTLMSTLALKQSEQDSVNQIQNEATYAAALMTQAEASLSEMRARLALSLSKSTEYVTDDDGRELLAASQQVKSVSETMRQTIRELS